MAATASPRSPWEPGQSWFHVSTLSLIPRLCGGEAIALSHASIASHDRKLCSGGSATHISVRGCV